MTSRTHTTRSIRLTGSSRLGSVWSDEGSAVVQRLDPVVGAVDDVTVVDCQRLVALAVAPEMDAEIRVGGGGQEAALEGA
jgi:hypothetical protein